MRNEKHPIFPGVVVSGAGEGERKFREREKVERELADERRREAQRKREEELRRAIEDPNGAEIDLTEIEE